MTAKEQQDEYSRNYLFKISFPAVIVVKEKAGTRYLDASSEPALYRSALFLLRDRFAEHCYPTIDSEESAPVDRYDEWLRAARSALERADGYLAWLCLRSRAGLEYEGISLAPIEDFRGHGRAPAINLDLGPSAGAPNA